MSVLSAHRPLGLHWLANMLFVLVLALPIIPGMTIEELAGAVALLSLLGFALVPLSRRWEELSRAARDRVLLALSGYLAVAAVVMGFVPYNETVFTYAPDRSPSGSITLHCGSPAEEAFVSGSDWVPDPPITVPQAACRHSSQMRLGGAFVALGASGLLLFRLLRRQIRHTDRDVGQFPVDGT